MDENIDLIQIIKNIRLEIKKYWLLILISCAFFVTLGCYINLNIKNTYKTSALLYLNGLSSNTTTSELINELSINSRATHIEEELQISTKLSESILKISAEIIEDDPKIIRIELQLSSIDSIIAIENGLLNYLNNNIVLQELSEQRINRHANTISKINEEQSKMDSIWNIKNSSLQNYGQFFDAKIKLEDLKNNYLDIIACQKKSFSYLKPFIQQANLIPKMKLSVAIILSFILSLVFSTILIASIEIYKKIKI